MKRIRSLFSHKPIERQVLLGLAAMRATLTGAASVSFMHLTGGMPFMVFALPIVACVVSVISADWLERGLRMLALGYVDNIRVSPRGEWEGWNGPTREDEMAGWRLTLREPIYPDQGLYPEPLPTFRERVRALPSVLW